MSWKLVKSIQKATELRLVLPVGLNLQLGDVISVDRAGGFTLEGNSTSLLGITVGNEVRVGETVAKFSQVYGKGTERVFRGEGKTSKLFDSISSVKAGFDITLGSSDSWVLAYRDRKTTTLPDVSKYRKAMLRAHQNRVWNPDGALVNQVSTVGAMTLLAARSSNTKVALELDGAVAEDTPIELKSTGGVSIAAVSSEVTHIITDRPMVAFCTGVRVKPGFFSTGFSTLESMQNVADEGWEDADDGIPGSDVKLD